MSTLNSGGGSGRKITLSYFGNNYSSHLLNMALGKSDFLRDDLLARWLTEPSREESILCNALVFGADQNVMSPLRARTLITPPFHVVLQVLRRGNCGASLSSITWEP